MVSEFIFYLWIGIGIAAAIVEVLTLKKIAIWIVPAGLIAFLLAFLEIDVWIQTCVFIIISLISIGLSIGIQKKSKKFIKSNETQKLWEYKNLIGKTAIVTEEIDSSKNTGSVRINGTIWTARSEDEEELYESGLVVTITSIDGDSLICSK